MARRPISLSLRFSVFERDKRTCQYCGRTSSEVELQIDHVHPVALGGDNRIDNLLTACRDCNIGKGARDPGLAMPSRPMTFGEQQAAERDEARSWADCVFLGAEPAVRSLLWEIAAKADLDGVIIRVWPDDWAEAAERKRMVLGLVAVGAVRIVVRGPGEWFLTIEHNRARGDDPGHPWTLGACGPVRLAPPVAEIH